ncbi:MAG: glutathione S-transferase family protein [Leptolyngbya sp. RL_3_1]|nr:glutathione S-transferase family protein [Leptolyngbya sp. RL_3_1]
MASSRLPKASLPPGLIVRAGRTVWHTLWQIMMSRLAPTDQAGAYVRPASQFRQRVDPAGPYPAMPDRYRLIVGMGCPWAHRTLVVRALKGLEAAVPIWRVNPAADEGFWIFEPDQKLEWRSLPELYQTAASGYKGRSTVPVLWDTESRTVVNNESADLIEILNGAFNDFAQRPEVDLYPALLKTEIDGWGDRIYTAVNNGVYRCGFARSQAAYEAACTLLFDTLEKIDQILTQQRYLCGDTLTLADVRLFTTLFRFDGVYHGLFKCDRRHLSDFEFLWPYARDIYQQPGVAATCDLDTVRREYYGNLFPLNPGGLIPLGPDPTLWERPHGRV